jgi:hypothetical protein
MTLDKALKRGRRFHNRVVPVSFTSWAGTVISKEEGMRSGSSIFIDIALAVLAFCIVAAFSQWLVPNHDSAIHVVEAQRLLAGARFYDDILETNPPLIVLLTMPGVLLSKAAGVDPWTGFTAWVWFLVLVSWRLGLPYLRWAYAGRPAAGVLLPAVYLAALVLVPGYDFAQREHLALVLCLPGLVWFAAREAGQDSALDLRCLITLVLAAVGLLIKPFFVAVPAALILYRAISHRNLRFLFGIETVVMLTVGIIYGAIINLFFQGWIATAALAAQVYFDFNAAPWWLVFYQFKGIILSLAATAMLFHVIPIPGRDRIFLEQLILAATTFLAVAFLQQKGWIYHALPSVQLIALLAGLMGLELIDLPRKKKTQVSFLAALCLISGQIAWYNYLDKVKAVDLRYNGFAKDIGELTAGKPWLALDVDVFPAFPTALIVNSQWSSRSPLQWMIPGIVKLSAGSEADRDRARKLRLLATRFVTEDLEKYRPATVAIRLHYQFVGVKKPFEFLPFFAEDEAFRRAWSPYRLVKSTSEWEFYQRTE